MVVATRQQGGIAKEADLAIAGHFRMLGGVVADAKIGIAAIGQLQRHILDKGSDRRWRLVRKCKQTTASAQIMRSATVAFLTMRLAIRPSESRSD